jgi:hypothetical protein
MKLVAGKVRTLVQRRDAVLERHPDGGLHARCIRSSA